MYRVFNYIEESKLYFDYDVIYTPGIHENKSFSKQYLFLYLKRYFSFIYIELRKKDY